MNNRYNAFSILVMVGIRRFKAYSLTGMFFLFAFSSCEDFLAVSLPKSKVASDVVFSSDITAIAAVTAIYDEMREQNNFASGSNKSITALAGLSSGELAYLSDQIGDNAEFELNNLAATNSYIAGLWTSIYKVIYQANAAIEGVSNASALTQQTRDQLEGEALFIRAFSHFYLVNLFGDIPLVSTTDYRSNAHVARAPVDVVYGQITSDLLRAQELLSDKYITTERVRPNKATAKAFLARVYLYRGNWSAAEEQASFTIDNTALYSLLQDAGSVFLKNSMEAIWQLPPGAPDGFTGLTHEGYFFSPANVSGFNVLSEIVMNAFEPGDIRASTWTGSFSSTGGTIYYPAKYKQHLPGPIMEYSMVLRLGEQYLIRAEARAQQGNLQGAISDLDAIRSRASLPLIQDINPGISSSDLLLAIERERLVELFSEWGHRWLDLKRSGKVDDVMSLLKAGWSSADALYPLPQSEFNKNANLGNQNPGY